MQNVSILRKGTAKFIMGFCSYCKFTICDNPIMGNITNKRTMVLLSTFFRSFSFWGVIFIFKVLFIVILSLIPISFSYSKSSCSLRSSLKIANFHQTELSLRGLHPKWRRIWPEVYWC